MTETGLHRDSLDPELYAELVRSLFGTPRAILAATLTAGGITAVAGLVSGDPAFLFFFIAYEAIGIVRWGANRVYLRDPPPPDDRRAIRRWEIGALIGAWAFSGLTGLTGAYTVLFQSGSTIEILIVSGVMGYVAGISSRNASRPLITVGQVSVTCVPFLLALAIEGGPVYWTLAIFIGLLYVSIISMSRTMHENIVARHRARQELEILALFDSLTGLSNRTAFMRHAAEKLATAGPAAHMAFLAIDLDRFKDINDTLGHPSGDVVLKETAHRIKACLRIPHEVARIGGDEFLVSLMGADEPQARAVADEIVAVLSEPFPIGNARVGCSASVGIALAPRDGVSLDELMRNADLALYAAKSHGVGVVVSYTPELSKRYYERLALEQDLQTAVDRGELELYYQPIIDVRTGKAVCCEALLRWNHPERGAIPPSEFIAIAEVTGQIVPIGAWVLDTACAEAASWDNDTKVAVNLSSVQFRLGHNVVAVVREALRKSGLAPRRLELEITETVLIEDTRATLAVLEELRHDGIGVSLDDFGTGFSSLAYLSDFPFSKIKLDRKFSSDIDRSPRTRGIVQGIAQITRQLGIGVVAEGIETREQLSSIHGLGINEIQGFLFSKPMPAAPMRYMIKSPIRPELLEGMLRRAPVKTIAGAA